MGKYMNYIYRVEIITLQTEAAYGCIAAGFKVRVCGHGLPTRLNIGSYL